MICGFFSTVNGVEVPHVARLNSNGSVDQGFKTPFVTLEQFNRDRFGDAHRVPVVQLTESAPMTNMEMNLNQTILITSIYLEAGVAVVQFTGVARHEYILQSSDSLNSGNWNSLSTNESDAAGNGNFRDADSVNHSTRFYRIASP